MDLRLRTRHIKENYTIDKNGEVRKKKKAGRPRKKIRKGCFIGPDGKNHKKRPVGRPKKKPRKVREGYKIDADGHMRKKSKGGRPKKRGPKKKYKKKKIVEKVDGRKFGQLKKQLNFKIVSCINNKEKGLIGKFHNEEEAYAYMNKLMYESDKVRFPHTTIHYNDTLKNMKYEYLILEKNRNGDKEDSILKNDLGIYTKQKSNSKDWVIFDKFKYNIEETFWVYGYDKDNDRKEYQWIFDNILMGDVYSKYDLKRVIKYKNKIIIKDDSGHYDVIFCIDDRDSIKFYNLILKDINDLKIKNVVMLGSYDGIKEKWEELVNDLIEQNGLTRKDWMNKYPKTERE